MHLIRKNVLVGLLLLWQSTCMLVFPSTSVDPAARADSSMTLKQQVMSYPVPADITLDVVIDDSSITASVSIQPLDSGDYVVIANRIYPYHPEPQQLFFAPGGMHSVICLYDSIKHLCNAWTEPYITDYDESEMYVFAVASQDRPLRFQYRRLFHAIRDSAEMKQITSGRYACLEAIACMPRDVLCRHLPEICAQDPWVWDSVAIVKDWEGERRGPTESANAKFYSLTLEQYSRITYDVTRLHNPLANIVTTIRTPSKH